MVEEPIDHSYFNWLCAKVLDNTFGIPLMLKLHRTQFTWVIPADRHRAQEGLELRFDFLRETNLESDISWRNEPCSVLEFLIAFAKRAQFQTDIAVKEWFWIFLTNLGLDECRSSLASDQRIIDKRLETFIWRTYEPSGFGGLFPMSRTQYDQREIELWYQWNEWIDDQGLI